MKPLTFLFAAIALLFGRTAHAQNAPPKPRLTLPEAVRRAETFIAQNGYTKAPPADDPAQITIEWIEVRFGINRKLDGTVDLPKIFARRKGMVEPTACAWKRYKATQYSQALWLIVFRTPRSKATGKWRGVWVSASGDVHMLHEDARLIKFLPLGRLPVPARL